MSWIDSVGRAAERIRTPMALAGTGLLILGVIFYRVLDLPVFSKVSQDETFRLLFLLIQGLFWLAGTVCVLAIVAWIISLLLASKIGAHKNDGHTTIATAGRTFRTVATEIARDGRCGIDLSALPSALLKAKLPDQEYGYLDVAEGLEGLGGLLP